MRTFRVAVVGGFVTRLGIGGLPFLLPLLYQLGMGLPAWESGLLMMPAAAAAMGMKLIAPRVLASFGYRQVLIVNTLMIGVTIGLFALVNASTPLPLIVVHRPGPGLLQFAAVLEHELDGLRRRRQRRFEHGEHDRQLAAADVAELRPGGRLAGHGLVSRRPAAKRPASP